MPVNPIDYGRYGNEEMIQIFEEKCRHGLWLQIEATIAQKQAELGIIPADAAEEIYMVAVPEKVTLSRTMEIEAKTRHDVAALYEAIAEQCEGAGARWVHFGLTSNDIKDTALGMQMHYAYHVFLQQIDALCEDLASRAVEFKDLIAIGRSHGQHAVPITYGLRFAVWLDEIRRHRQRLIEARNRVVVGKIAGATGSHSALGPDGIKLQEMVLTELGLQVPNATTQITQRDRHAEAVLCLANLAASLDKIATDIRNLQRTEIGEMYEPFKHGEQVGSSAMPHKRNPVICEKISGLARVVRSLAAPALENVVSWEERDISHSSTERFVIPQAFILTDYLVREMRRVIEGLELDRNAIEKNLNVSKEMVLSEYIITKLTRAGLERPKAHARLRELVEQSRKEDKDLLELIRQDSEVSDNLDIDKFDIEEYYDQIRESSRRIVEKTIEAFQDDVASTE
ncbi:adenylosuccinate lyase [Candidatus Thorarchaeota archaeon]|nr:MAG: adenylosuccinate lyase [Candidatus Thorarchaeota archaeon]